VDTALARRQTSQLVLYTKEMNPGRNGTVLEIFQLLQANSRKMPSIFLLTLPSTLYSVHYSPVASNSD
jgi:hypothetical protein